MTRSRGAKSLWVIPPPKLPAPDPQKVVDLTFALLMAAREHHVWFAGATPEQIGEWAAAKLAENGIPTEPSGSSYGVLTTQRPHKVSEPVLDAWDGLRGAINDVLTAQPSRMSEASHKLEVARIEFSNIMTAEAMGR